MNSLKAIIKIGTLALALVSCGNTALAENTDYMDWKNGFIIYTDYDSGDEELTITLGVDSSGPTDSDYVLEFDIADDTCETDMKFTYSTYKVQGECTVSIDQEDMRGVFTVDSIIKDEDGDTDYDGEIQFEVDGYGDDFNWADLKTEATYDGEDKDLEITVTMEDVIRSPDKDYSLELDIMNKTITKDMRYHESDDELRAVFSITVSESDIENSYSANIRVFSEDIHGDEHKEYSHRANIDVDIKKTEDDFDWSDLDITSIYNEDRKRLELTLSLSKIKDEPLRRYTADIELDKEDYDERFDWNEDTDELVASFNIRIDEEDIEDDYDIDVRITDDKNKRVLSDEYNVDVDIQRTSDDFDWNDLDIDLTYYEEEEELEIRYTLSRINQKPVFTYTVDMEIDDSDYDKEFSYSSNDDELSASFLLAIDSDEVLGAYSVDSLVRNNEKHKEYDETSSISVERQSDKNSNTSSNTEQSGEEKLSLQALYDYDRELLQIHVDVINVATEPKGHYTAELAAGGRTQVRRLQYDSHKKKLSYPFSIYTTHDNARDSYAIYLVIKDENDKMVHTTRETLNVGDKPTNTGSTESNNNTNSNSNSNVSSSDAKINKAVDNYIKKVEERYKTISKRRDYLEYTMDALNEIATKKTKYKTTVKKINTRIQTRLDFYDEVLSELNLD